MLFTVQAMKDFPPIRGGFHGIATAAQRELQILAYFRLVVRNQDCLAIWRSVHSSCHKSQRTAYFCLEVNNPGKFIMTLFVDTKEISFG